MSIMSDKWITNMSLNHGMIDPFVDSQVKKSQKGGGLISFGVSSYGYDAVRYYTRTLSRRYSLTNRILAG